MVKTQPQFASTCVGPNCYGYPTPKGQPSCWLYWESPFDLAYLSWGRRWYGRTPARARPHDGWHYFVTLSGTPSLVANGRPMPLQPGDVTISHPQCVKGNIDEPERQCEMLTFIWRSPPGHSSLRPPEKRSLLRHVDARVLSRLRALHARCRAAVARADERSLIELRVARLQLDLLLLDGAATEGDANPDFRIELATEYLRNHLNEQEPVGKLCQYLHISEASLKRLFREHTGRSPRDYALEWKMRWAHEQLAAPGASVKSIAYALGYRHANDFSRAFKRHHGTTASDVIGRAGGK